MGKYLINFNYSVAGIQGLEKDGGTVRRQVVDQLVQGLGGRVESFYFCFGKYDAVVIVDLPDNVAAAAASLIVGASGSGEFQTTTLLTPAELDEAVKRRGTYTAPGAPRAGASKSASASNAPARGASKPSTTRARKG